MVTQKAPRSAYGFYALIACPLVLSGCLAGTPEQFFAPADDGNEPFVVGSGANTPTPTPSQGGGELSTLLRTESFQAASSRVKKIDFLFVVDNSGSMSDNQRKLAAGFEEFANTFYRRTDLDICTAIITTDRYVGKSSGTYQRERFVECTQPAGSEAWSDAQRQAHIDAVIADFKQKVNVGVNGSGIELPGKSLVSFLYKLNQWGNTIDTTKRVSFFRPDAVANISFVTDENNWFYRDPNKREDQNDLPPVQNASIYNSLTPAIDVRKGIKDHLDEFFTLNRPGHGLSYSTVALLELEGSTTQVPGLATNINPLVELVGRESNRGSLQGTASSFAAVYYDIADSIINRANAFSLTKSIYEPQFPSLQDLRVTLKRANAAPVVLSAGSDYQVLMPNGIVLQSAISAQTQVGDVLEVQYRHLQ
jgi:hypothetical protein